MLFSVTRIKAAHSMCIKVCLANLRVGSEVYTAERVRWSIWGYTTVPEKK